jgi:4-amino-4-deoxy-L-arabinose transferase-like glycosyltransferase
MWALACVLVVAAAIRGEALWRVSYGAPLIGDENYYVRHAEQLAEGTGYGDSMRAPLWPAVMAVVFTVVGPHVLAARLAGIGISLATIVLLFFMVRRSFGVREALLSGLLCAVAPGLVHYAHLLWAENLLAFWIVAFLWLMEGSEGKGPSGLLLAGFALGFAALTKEVMLIFAPLAVYWCWHSYNGRSTRWLRALALTGGIAIVVLPWTIRNAIVLRRLVVVSTIRWMPIALGNLRLDGEHASEPFFHRYASDPDELRREAMARREALDAVWRHQPWWLWRKVVQNVPAFLAPQIRLEDARFSSAVTRMRLLAVESAVDVLVLSIGIAGLWLVPGARIKWLMVALLLYLFAVHIAANADPRFRAPLMPLLAFYGGPLLAGRCERGPGLPYRAAGAAGSIAILLLAVAACLGRGW